MRSTLALFLALVLTLGFSSPAAALPSVPVENGMVIGGQWTMANMTKAEVTNLSDLNGIEVAQIGDLSFCHVGHGPLPANDHAVLNGNGGKSSGWAGKTKREDERKEQRKS